ncbi:MAG TPA: hypothetical protein DC057_00145 [Spirochaetia bacterium]|nr:hypothetical protein [Spirochaetia bacterium]
MDRSTFWTGYFVYAVIQGMIVMARLIKLIEISWWLVFIPTILIFLGAFVFLVYLSFVYNLRIEKDDKESKA